MGSRSHTPSVVRVPTQKARERGSVDRDVHQQPREHPLEVRAGHLLSLQLHEVKHETLFLRSGLMLFTRDAEVFEWTPGEVIEIPPGTVHRMEAVEDSVILEVSTPQLEDVVRLEDRYGRTTG